MHHGVQVFRLLRPARIKTAKNTDCYEPQLLTASYVNVTQVLTLLSTNLSSSQHRTQVSVLYENHATVNGILRGGYSVEPFLLAHGVMVK